MALAESIRNTSKMGKYGSMDFIGMVKNMAPGHSLKEAENWWLNVNLKMVPK